jgi:hypothetical protein
MSILKKTIPFLISKMQNNRLRSYFLNKNALFGKPVVGFLIEDKDSVNGGLLSICKIAEISRRILPDNHIQIFTAQPKKYITALTKFENNAQILNFKTLLKQIKAQNIEILHIAEFLLPWFGAYVTRENLDISALHINILNQNITLMPPKAVIDTLKAKAKLLTQTTAHEKYSGESHFLAYDIPLKHISTYVSPQYYAISNFSEKENLILLSPDRHAIKADVLSQIKTNLSYFSTFLIKGIPYKTYRAKVNSAKYMLSFGEGLDNYFIETVFSGGIPFTLFEKDFMPDNMKNLENVSLNPQEFAQNIISLIKKCENDTDFRQSLWQKNFDCVAAIYKNGTHETKLREFYAHHYDFG